MALGLVAGLLAFILVKSVCSRPEHIAAAEVWSFIQEVAPERGLDPEFVYALAWAESSLNAKARSSVARGIMQLTRPAWAEVSEVSYRQAWDWKTNIRVAVDYLAFCRDFLERHDAFTYPLLAASYRYGPYHVQDKGFDIRRLRRPKNELYRRIFEGEVHPVAPPESRGPEVISVGIGRIGGSAA